MVRILLPSIRDGLTQVAISQVVGNVEKAKCLSLRCSVLSSLTLLRCAACLQMMDDLSLESVSARRAVRYGGRGVTLPLLVSYAARGGQVVLSEPAWESVKDAVTQHPGAVSVLSLGMHVLSCDFHKPMHLMEVMPNLLSRRNFAHIQTKRLVEPGYRDAPDPSKPMAMVFMKVGLLVSP